MTAIAAVHTPQGFAIAADGRRSWQYRATDISRQFESETVQKIFEIASDDVALAYFIRGDTVSEDGSWDIASQIREAVQSVNEAKCSTCLRFADALCAAVQGGIEKARSLRRLDGYPNTQICILGYFRGTASWIDAIFQPRLNQCGVHYHLFPRDCDGRIFLSGSQILDQMIVREDARIAVQLPFRTASSSLPVAVSFVRNYVETCCSPLIRNLEPDGCKTVGGHIHVATVMKPIKTLWFSKLFRKRTNADGGFKWATPPFHLATSLAP